MKKISIVITLTIAVLAALPLIGNKFVSNTLNERVAQMKQYGLNIQETKEQNGYLSSSKHYEFVVDDAAKFLEYLNQYATNQIPPYVDSVVNGVVVGVDVGYTNIPFFSSVEVDIYPLELAPEMTQSIKHDDPNFYDQLHTFLGAKGMNYHINYHLTSKQFEGYIKDIDQNFQLKDKTDFNIVLSDAKFSGEGELIAPVSSNLDLGKLNVHIESKNSRFTFNVEGLHTRSDFLSKATYKTDMSLKNFKFVLDEKYDDVYMKFSDVKVEFGSDDTQDTATIWAVSGFKEMVLKNSELDLLVKNFNYKIELSKLDKESFEKLQTLLAQQNGYTNNTVAKDLEASVKTLLAKGLRLNIENLSLENIVYNNNKDYKGLVLNAVFDLKADQDNGAKLQNSPIQLLENVTMDSRLQISKEIYAEMLNNGVDLAQYAQMQDDTVVFKSVFKDSHLSINGKTIQ
ncbi:MAG: DUF945 family protein [Campylobacterales bacterium]|nr:DUF945 family protein [Campylobacterales bacterium]